MFKKVLEFFKKIFNKDGEVKITEQSVKADSITNKSIKKRGRKPKSKL